MNNTIDNRNAEKLQSDELFTQLDSSLDGLDMEEADLRLALFGRNTLGEKKSHPRIRLLNSFWGPIPWMAEVAVVLAALARHWVGFIIIMSLLIVNAVIGFWQEHKVAKDLEVLKNQLAQTGRVRRDQQWTDIDAAELVPGDMIRLRSGDIIPADAKLIEGIYLLMDQSLLTGESLPTSKTVGDVVYAGAIARQGEMLALVIATGRHTFFGRTARPVKNTGLFHTFKKLYRPRCS